MEIKAADLHIEPLQSQTDCCDQMQIVVETVPSTLQQVVVEFLKHPSVLMPAVAVCGLAYQRLQSAMTVWDPVGVYDATELTMPHNLVPVLIAMHRSSLHECNGATRVQQVQCARWSVTPKQSLYLTRFARVQCCWV